MRRVAVVLLVVLVAVVLLYLSRFWPVQLWSRQSFLSDVGLRPNGDLIRIWLRGTVLAQFDLLFWGLFCFFALSSTEKVAQRING